VSGADADRTFFDEKGRSLISVAAASALSHLTPSFLRRLLRQGKIEGVKIGRDWFTTEEAVREYMATDRRPGPKTK
jgi:excisionase family DNA binding protein